MKVSELIKELEKLPQDARVFHLWDGEPRTEIQQVWLSKKGHIVTSDYDQVCYSDKARPVAAPGKKQVQSWKTVNNPKKFSEGDDFNEYYPWD